MRFPQEAIGIKDGPQEVRIKPDGSLDVAEGKEVWFAAGNPPVPLKTNPCSKRLLNGYLPIVIAEWDRDGLMYEQTAIACSEGFRPDAPLTAYVRLRIFNSYADEQEVDVQLALKDPILTWHFVLPPRGNCDVFTKIPYGKPLQSAKIEADEFRDQLGKVKSYWESLLSKGMKIDVPERRVQDAYRAWLAYNFIDVDKNGEVYEPHDSSGIYEKVYGYSASRYGYMLDLYGYHDEAQEYLDSLLSFLTPEGLLVVNFGLPDTGVHLWAMSWHYRMTGDEKWFRVVAPTMMKMCDWIIAARRESIATQPKDSPWYGLIKYRPYCDEKTPAYSYFTDSYLQLGLQETAMALRSAGYVEQADRIASESESYRSDILRSMDRAIFSKDGMKMLPIFPETHALLERVGYTGADYYGLISSCVLETGILPANDHRAQLITNLLEQKSGLSLGVCAFKGGIDHAYTYGYWMNCMERDEVERVLLGFYTSLAYGMSHDTYSSVEVNRLRTGDNDPTLLHLYSATQQLLLLRNMLLRENGDTLVLGQAIPRTWLEDGKEVRIDNAPTLFGNVSYSIQSVNDARRMIVRLSPPRQISPKSICIHLRQPEGKTIKRVFINGVESKDYSGNTVTLHHPEEPTVIEAHF